MKLIKNNLKLFIGIFIGIILAGLVGGVVYAAVSANQISYTTNKNVQIQTVADGLNDLYNKTNKTPQAVATLTTQGATYTMQNDGFIVGTAKETGDSMAKLFLDNKTLILSDWSGGVYYDVSIYATKDTVVTTRSNGGTYNLTVYEWK